MNRQSFCRLPTVACTGGTDRTGCALWSPRQLTATTHSQDSDPLATDGAWPTSELRTVELGSCRGCSAHPHNIPAVPYITSVSPSPQKTSRTTSSPGAGGREDDAFPQSLHHAMANVPHQCPQRFAPLTRKVLPVQQRICGCHGLSLNTGGTTRKGNGLQGRNSETELRLKHWWRKRTCMGTGVRNTGSKVKRQRYVLNATQHQM